MFDDSDHWGAFWKCWETSGFFEIQEFVWLSDTFSSLSDKFALLSDTFALLSDKVALLSDKFALLSDKFVLLSDKVILCEQTLFFRELDSWLVDLLLVSKLVSY